MSLVFQNGGLIKKHGSLGRATNGINFCCCGGCPTCPDLCGYYIEAKAGALTYYPLQPGSDLRVEKNDLFCTEQEYLSYPRAGREGCCVATEVEGTPALPSTCGLGSSDIQYRGYGSVANGFAVSASISAELAVGDGITSEPRAMASLGLSCLNGVWTATVNWQVNRFVNGSLIQCSARKVFPIRTGCSADATCPVPGELPPEGSNIHGRVFTVTGDGVTVSNIGTVLFDEDDRLGDCSGDACLSAWRAMWQARFQVYRVPCTEGCEGSCSESAPCPEGCCCIEGQCVAPEKGQCCGPCDDENPCDEGCLCEEGECVPADPCCCVDGEIVQATQSDCEECGVTRTCYEYTYVEEGQECPEGFTPDGWGGCSRVTNPASCSQCSGWCDTQQTGLCGTFYPSCSNAPTRSYVEIDFSGFSCGVIHYHGPNGKVVTNGQTWFDMAQWPQLTQLANQDAAFQLIGTWDDPSDCEAYLAAYMENPVEVSDTVYPGSPCGWPNQIRCVTVCVDTNNPLP